MTHFVEKKNGPYVKFNRYLKFSKIRTACSIDIILLNIGVSPSPVGHLVWDQAVGGSNPLIPKLFCEYAGYSSWKLTGLITRVVASSSLAPAIFGQAPYGIRQGGESFVIRATCPLLF